MAIKPFKLRISRVITSLQSCNSKDTYTLPEDPVPSFLIRQPSPPKNTKLITTVDFPVTAPSNTRRSSSALKRHVSSALISVGCGLTSRAASSRNSGDCRTRSRPPQEFKWRKEEKWHVVANIYDETQPRRKIYSSSGDENDDVLALPPPPPPPSASEKKKGRSRKKKTATFRISTSSADESGLFSNDEEETETLVSSLSTDSSFEFNPKTDYTNRRNRRNRIPKKRAANRGGPLQQTTKIIPSVPPSTTSSEEGELPARLSVFKKLIPCSVDGKVKESFAIVKRSRDPHEDFKRSMMEMILEKRMFEKDDLEQLLQCFLSLNARQYHGIIVGAFSEIWEDLFSNNANNVISSTHRMC